MAGLGSVTEGMLGTQMDLQNIQMNNLKIQDASVGLQRDKLQLQQQLKLAELMSGAKLDQVGGTPDGMAGMLSNVAALQLQAGMPDAAAKTASSASRLQENSSKIDYRSFRMQNDRLTKFANILSQVPDSPQGLTEAFQTMAAEDPSVAKDPKFQNLMRMGWKPGLIGELRNQVLSTKDREDIKYKQAQEGHLSTQELLDRTRVGLIKEQTKLAEGREKALAKVGAIPYKAEQLKAVTDMATTDYPSADPADVRVRSRPLAEEVSKMMVQQRLSLSEATTRVYQQARSSGAFSGLRTAPEIKGTKPGLALPLPKDAKKARNNMWYTVGGKPMLNVEGRLYSEDELDDLQDEAEDSRDESEDDNAEAN